MNVRDKAKTTRILAILVIILIPVLGVSIYVIHVNSVQVTPELNTLRTPFNVNYLGFDVHDGENDSFIASVEPGKQFVDPTHRYPGVDVFRSGAFFVDPAGNYVENCPDSYLEPYGTIAIGGKVYYAHELRYGFDFGVRTVGNMPGLKSCPSSVSPLWGYSIPKGDGGTYTFMLDDPDYPELSAEEVLTGYYANDGFGHVTVNFLSGAAITCSLEPIDIRVGDNPRDAVNTIDTALETLRTRYGNSQVRVYPKVALTALPSFFTPDYDFNGTLAGDDVTFTVSPGPAQIGISNVDKSWIHDKKDVIPNTLQQELEAIGIQTTIPVTGNVEDLVKTDKFDESEYDESAVIPTTSQLVSGSIEYMGSATPEVVGGFADTYGSVDTNTTIPDYEFYLDESATTLINNYPGNVQLTMGNTLQPLTTVSIANFAISWDVAFVNPIVGNPSHYGPGSDTVEIPHAIRIENMYTVQRMLVSVIVLTENTITAVGPTGEPIDVSYLTDYQLNQIIKDPNRDIFYRDANVRYTDWETIWESAGFITFIVVAIVIAVTFFGGWLFIKFMRGRSGGGSGGLKPASNWEIKLGKFRWRSRSGGSNT